MAYTHAVAFDFDLCESVFLRQKKTDEQWHIVADAHRLERSETLAISFLNLNQRAQDNPTVYAINTAPIWLQSSLPDACQGSIEMSSQGLNRNVHGSFIR